MTLSRQQVLERALVALIIGANCGCVGLAGTPQAQLVHGVEWEGIDYTVPSDMKFTVLGASSAVKHRLIIRSKTYAHFRIVIHLFLKPFSDEDSSKKWIEHTVKSQYMAGHAANETPPSWVQFGSHPFFGTRRRLDDLTEYWLGFSNSATRPCIVQMYLPVQGHSIELNQIRNELLDIFRTAKEANITSRKAIFVPQPNSCC